MDGSCSWLISLNSINPRQPPHYWSCTVKLSVLCTAKQRRGRVHRFGYELRASVVGVFRPAFTSSSKSGRCLFFVFLFWSYYLI